MTIEELAARLDVNLEYLKKRMDEVVETNKHQWEAINQHSQDLAVLKNHDKQRIRQAQKSGAGAGAGSGFLISIIWPFIRDFFKGWLAKL